MSCRRALVVLALCVSLLPLVVGAARAKEEPPLASDQAVPVDPAIEKQGRLDNGFRYWICHHGMPAGQVSLLLRIHSGSLQETEAQRGLAHFVEHLAFNGSEHFRPGEVVRYFESLGMTFGMHQNAFTTFDQTTYTLSLPDTKPGTIEKALLFLTDVAHRLTIAPEEVEKERAVILEEHRARQSVNLRVLEKTLSRCLPGARLTRRMPIGDLDVVREAPPELLRAYYETWYRPDRATLLVVGDVETAVMEPLVRRAFGDWKATTPAPDEVEAGETAAPVRDVALLTDPELTEARFLLSALQPVRSVATVGDVRRALVERLGRSVLNRRLERLVQEDQAAFSGNTAVEGGESFGGYRLGGLGGTCLPDRWEAALTQVVTEVRRLREHGLDEAELASVKEVFATRLDQYVQAADDVESSLRAMSLNEALGNGWVPASAVQMRDLGQRLLPGIDAEAVQRAFAEQIDPANTLVLLLLPEHEDIELPGREAILATLDAALKAELAPWESRAAVTSLLEKEPEPGTVVGRSVEETLGVTSLALENGIRVHVKPMPEAGEVIVRINLYGGLLEESAENRGVTEAASIGFTAGRQATERHTPADLSSFLEPRAVSVNGGVEDLDVHLIVQGTPEGLPDGLRLAHLLLTEPRIDPTALESWKGEVASQLAQLEMNVPTQGFLGLRSLASGGDPRMGLPIGERYAGLTAEEAQAWLDRLVAEAPIEVAIAGGIDVAEAERLARTYLGSLPVRPDRWKAIHALRKVRTPEGPLAREIEVESVTPIAMVLLVWRGVSLDDAPRQIALSHAGTILTARLMKTVREEKGLTYSIGSQYLFTDYEGLDGLIVQFTASPEKAVEAAQVAKEVVLELAKDGPTDEEITSAERQMANSLDTQMQHAAFWIAVLAKLHVNARTPHDARTRLEALHTIDREVLLETLREVLVDTRFARVIARSAGS